MYNKKVYKKYKNQQKIMKHMTKSDIFYTQKSAKVTCFLVNVVTCEKHVKLQGKSLIWLSFLTSFWTKNAQKSYIFYKLVVKKNTKKMKMLMFFGMLF